MQEQSILTTYDDYRLLPNDGNRYEIMDGELYMTPAPSTEHQEVSLHLERTLLDYLEKSHWGKLYHAPVDVVLSMTDVVQPDIVLISKERSAIITRKNIVAAPDIVIEIISETTEKMDRITKKAVFERFGVAEYWIVDPEKKVIEVFKLMKEKYESPIMFKHTDMLTSSRLPGLSLSLRLIFT
ncbi:MAG: Uma2 family endonuclease [Bacteroidota bacterium]